jgi:hypothetical protein
MQWACFASLSSFIQFVTIHASVAWCFTTRISFTGALRAANWTHLGAISGKPTKLKIRIAIRLLDLDYRACGFATDILGLSIIDSDPRCALLGIHIYLQPIHPIGNLDARVLAATFVHVRDGNRLDFPRARQ